MRLNFDTLFSKYLTDPWSPKLSTVEKILATISLVAFTILTVGLIFPLTAHLRNRKIDPIEQSGERLKEIASRIGKIVPQSLTPYTDPTLRADKMGFKVGEYHKNFPAITKETRYGVRDQTKKDLESLFGCSFDELANNFDPSAPLMKLREALPLVRLFTTGHQEFYPTDGKELLGRFDVLAVPAKMNYDAHWRGPQDKLNYFYIHHAAAINIGESAHARDFKDYSLNGTLDEEKYVADMARIFENMLTAQEKMGVTDAVWFPFGMGAFLRNLKKNDAAYNDPQTLYQLREKIASAFAAAALSHPKLKIHLCLPAAEAGEESTQNHNAFIRALESVKEEIGEQVRLYINVDATELAQKLAEEKGLGKVSLANGANRNMIGNHWFDDFAMTAIDENIHRRSILAAAMALVLNEGCVSQVKAKDALKERVLKHGGAVESLYSKIS